MDEEKQSKKLKLISENTQRQMGTPVKRPNNELDPNSPSPSAKQEGILKIKESELLVHIRQVVT